MVRLATKNDLEQVTNLYIQLVNFMKNRYSYFTWDNDIYPTCETALEGISKNEMYVYIIDNQVAGTVIINEKPPVQYKDANFKIKKGKILVVHTLAVLPKYLRQGIAKKILEFIDDFGVQNKYDSIQLDTYSKNQNAIKLYESQGYNFVGLVDLELGFDELYRCYEKKLMII